jgi:hypothetical protein
MRRRHTAGLGVALTLVVSMATVTSASASSKPVHITLAAAERILVGPLSLKPHGYPTVPQQPPIDPGRYETSCPSDADPTWVKLDSLGAPGVEYGTRGSLKAAAATIYVLRSAHAAHSGITQMIAKVPLCKPHEVQITPFGTFVDDVTWQHDSVGAWHGLRTNDRSAFANAFGKKTHSVSTRVQLSRGNLIIDIFVMGADRAQLGIESQLQARLLHNIAVAGG